MVIRFPFIIFLLIAFAMTGAWLHGGTDFVGKRSAVEHQRVQPGMWSSGKENRLMQKTFPIQEWNKHFSSVGGKRAPISTNNVQDRKTFRTETRKFPTKNFEMSRWSQRMTELQQQAQIDTDVSAQRFADAELYGAMLQGTRQYEELAEKVSLRDINRFQFRRNHPDGDIPVDRAGGRGSR